MSTSKLPEAIDHSRDLERISNYRLLWLYICTYVPHGGNSDFDFSIVRADESAEIMDIFHAHRSSHDVLSMLWSQFQDTPTLAGLKITEFLNDQIEELV
jgi:hypothetical protein